MLRYAALAAVTWCAAARGQDLPQTSSLPNIRDVMLARDYAMGGAYRAHGLGTEAVTGNPAALTLYRRYQLETGGAWDIPSGFAFGTVAVADSQTSQLGAGLAYHLVAFGNANERRLAHLNTLALALPFADFLHLGAAIRNIIETGFRESNAITLDAGIMIKPFETFSFGFAGHNLIDTNNPDMSRWYSGSVAWVSGTVTLAGDMRADFGVDPDRALFAWSIGGEYIFGEGLPLRLGYQWDGIAKTQYFSTGIGLMSDGGGLDIGYRHEIGGAEGRMLSVTLKIFVH